MLTSLHSDLIFFLSSSMLRQGGVHPYSRPSPSGEQVRRQCRRLCLLRASTSPARPPAFSPHLTCSCRETCRGARRAAIRTCRQQESESESVSESRRGGAAASQVLSLGLPLRTFSAVALMCADDFVCVSECALDGAQLTSHACVAVFRWSPWGRTGRWAAADRARRRLGWGSHAAQPGRWSL
jgi:hypothetical protein